MLLADVGESCNLVVWQRCVLQVRTLVIMPLTYNWFNQRTNTILVFLLPNEWIKEGMHGR